MGFLLNGILIIAAAAAAFRVQADKFSSESNVKVPFDEANDGCACDKPCGMLPESDQIWVKHPLNANISSLVEVEWPFYARIRNNNTNTTCDGAFINGEQIITTADCVADAKAQDLSALLGYYDFTHDITRKIQVTSVCVSRSSKNSFAILTLDKRHLSKKSSPVCMPKVDFEPDLDDCHLVGFADATVKQRRVRQDALCKQAFESKGTRLCITNHYHDNHTEYCPTFAIGQPIFCQPVERHWDRWILHGLLVGVHKECTPRSATFEGQVAPLADVLGDIKRQCSTEFSPFAVSHCLCPSCGSAPLHNDKLFQHADNATTTSQNQTQANQTKPRLQIRLGVPRVLYGKAREYGAFPSFASLWFRRAAGEQDFNFCGGVLIADDLVLTAAHCTTPRPDRPNHPLRDGLSGKVYVKLGDYSRLHVDKHEQHVDVLDECKSPEFRREIYNITDYGVTSALSADWTILRLKDGVKKDNYVQPACMIKSNASISRDLRCYVVGLGSITDTTRYTHPSHVQSLQVVPTPCTPATNVAADGDRERICFASKKPGQGDACQGDSGGPVLCRSPEGKRWFVAGIISYGDPICTLDWPWHGVGVYTNLARLKSSMAEACAHYERDWVFSD